MEKNYVSMWVASSEMSMYGYVSIPNFIPQKQAYWFS